MKQEHSKNRVLCIWLPNWPIQRRGVERRGHKGQKRALVLYEERRGNRVVAHSDRRGIWPGMALAEASAMGNVDFEPHDPAADLAGLQKLAAWCEQFSPLVGIEGTDNLCLEIGGTARLFGGEELLIAQVHHALQRMDLVARLAIADTLGAAWAVARYGEHAAIVPPGQMGLALGKLPVSALRLDDVDILSELGVQRIDQLLALPRDALAARFDSQLLVRLDQALGQAAEPIVSHRPQPEVVVEKLLEYPVVGRQAVEAVVGELCEQVCQRLIERQQGVVQLECRLQCETGEPIAVEIGLYRATAQAKHLCELLEMRLDRLVLPGPVAAAKLVVLTAARLESRQQDLFEAAAEQSSRHVGLLVDRLSSRLGRNNVVRAAPQADAQPEFAFRYEPLAGVATRKQPKPWPKRLPRPLRFLWKPAPLEAISVAPDGPPVRFEWDGSQQVSRVWGPERIQCGWWRGRYVQRDYYRVETTTGQRFWLFRRLSDGKWFLHGVFD